MGVDRVILEGGLLFDPASRTQEVCDVLIQGKRIVKKGHSLAAQFPEEEVLDCEGLWVLPGLIDLHTHFRQPGYEYKETIETGSMAAAAGGFTTVACMPNTFPVNDNPSVTRYILEVAEREALIEVLPIGAVTKGQKGKQLSEIGLMKEAGIVAVSDDGWPIRDGAMLRIAMEYSRRFGIVVIDHCEDLSLSGGGSVHEGVMGTRLGLTGISSVSESVMVARDVLMAQWLEIPVHIAHVSCKGSVDILRWAKTQGIPVSSEVTPHHLSLTVEDLYHSAYDTSFKVNPPLREEEDRQALLSALKEGVINCVATDHAPHDIHSKTVEFDYASSGISGLETALPVVLEAGKEVGMSPLEVIEKMTIAPARVLALERGGIAEGDMANLVLFDPSECWTVNPDDFFSKGKNSPFAGRTLKGRVKGTIFQGGLVFVDRGNRWGKKPFCGRGVVG